MRSRKSLLIILTLLFILTCSSVITIAQDNNLVTLQVRGADIKDVLVMLTDQSGMNMVPDRTVQGQVTINLKNVKLEEALETLTMAYDYQFEKTNSNTYLVSKKKFNFPMEVKVEDDQLTLRVVDGEIRTVLNKIAQQAGINIVMNNSVTGKVSIDLKDVALNSGLRTLLQANGFSLSKNGEIYRVFKVGKSNSRNNLAISVIDDKVSINVEQADLSKVLRTISQMSGKDMVLFGGVRERVDLKLDQIPLEEAIKTMLSGTRFTYRKVDGVYLIGDKNVNSPAASLFTTNELIPLQYLQAEKIPKLLPNNFPASNIKVLKEQNAILVTGTQEDIDKLKKYIAKIDKEIPQIVVEALIIDISYKENESPVSMLDMDYDQEETTFLDSSLGKLTYKSILELPTDFRLKLKALVDKGKVTIKANPNITTLNGQEARINVENVQYYKVTNTDEDGKETSEYQSINGGVTLKVTPWVSSSGEITLKLEPSISNLGGATGGAESEGPPQVSRREASTTVRVKDGETVIIGGLIQDVKTIGWSKVPILGDIPLLGRLFRSRSEDITKNELVMYITPHVLEEGSQEAKESKEEMLKKAEKDLQED